MTNSFFIKKTFLLMQKNNFSSEKLILKSQKSKIRYDFHCFLIIWLIFFVFKIDQLVKKTLCFTSKPTSEKSIIWGCYVPRRSNHQKCIFKNIDKTYMFWSNRSLNVKMQENQCMNQINYFVNNRTARNGCVYPPVGGMILRYFPK